MLERLVQLLLLLNHFSFTFTRLEHFVPHSHLIMTLFSASKKLLDDVLSYWISYSKYLKNSIHINFDSFELVAIFGSCEPKSLTGVSISISKISLFCPIRIPFKSVHSQLSHRHDRTSIATVNHQIHPIIIIQYTKDDDNCVHKPTETKPIMIKVL